MGYPSAPNQVVGGARTRDIIGGWWQLFKGGFNEHSTQRWRVKNIDLILGLVREVEKEDEEEEGGWHEEEVKGPPSCVRTEEAWRGGLVSRSWNS